MSVSQCSLKEVPDMELPMKVTLGTDDSHWVVAGSLDAEGKK